MSESTAHLIIESLKKTLEFSRVNIATDIIEMEDKKRNRGKQIWKLVTKNGKKLKRFPKRGR